jgi:ABC-type amino acid transport system permease subunit
VDDMTSTQISVVPTALPRRRHRKVSFRVGAWSWIVTGAGHTLLDIARRSSPSDADASVNATLRSGGFELLGLHRTYYEVSMGVSLLMGVCIVFVGVLLLHIQRLTPPQGLRAAATLGLAMSAAALAVSAWLEPPPPIVFFSAACVAFGLAVRSSGRLAADEEVRAPAKVR